MPQHLVSGDTAGGDLGGTYPDPTVDSTVSDTAYDAASWNGVTDIAPSKNAVRDKFNALDTSLGVIGNTPTADKVLYGNGVGSSQWAQIVDDTAYGSSWDSGATPASAFIAPSKNAVYDKIETLSSATVSDTAYDATSWDGVTTVAPSKNAVRDKFESVIASIPVIDDTAYDATTWNGDLDAASKNAIRDKFESVVSLIPVVSDTVYGSSWNANTDAPSKNAVYDRVQEITSYFIFDDGGSQSGIRFNTWSDLITALAATNSPVKEIIVETSFTLPSGAHDLKGATLRGLQPDATFFAPVVITAPEGATLTNVGATILKDGIILYSTATTHSTITISGGGRYNIENDCIITAEAFPLIDIASADPTFLIFIRGSGMIHPATFGLSAETTQEVVDHTGAGDFYVAAPSGVTIIDDDTIVGDVNIIVQSPSAFLDITGTGVPTGTSHINGTVAYVAKSSWATNISYDNAAGSLAATTVQAAIDEIADDSDVYTPTNVTPDRAFDADATSTAELADVLGTLIADLQDRGIIG